MASKSPGMIVDYTPEALANLDEIWEWNAEQYGRVHADSYVEFLRKRTDRLSTDYASGKPVPTNPTLLYRVIQKRKKRHGHIAVYEVNDNEVIRILRYFHPGLAEQARINARRNNIPALIAIPWTDWTT